MATLNKPRSLLQTIQEVLAERLSRYKHVPADDPEAFRRLVVAEHEQTISAVLGADSIVVSGWVMPPSQRLDRRERIEAALRAGESVKAIAGRELVSQRWVWRVQAEMRDAEQSPPEQFSAGRQQ